MSRESVCKCGRSPCYAIYCGSPLCALCEMLTAKVYVTASDEDTTWEGEHDEARMVDE